MPDDNTSAPFTVAHDKMLKEIHTALVGNPSLGVKGLVLRTAEAETGLETVKEQVRDHGRKIWLVTVVGGGVWATIVAFKENIFGK